MLLSYYINIFCHQQKIHKDEWLNQNKYKLWETVRINQNAYKGTFK